MSTNERIEYTPYGESWIEWKDYSENNYVTPFRFTSKEKDMETGLYYYGARYLDAKTSRWMSADPALGEYIPAPGTGPDKLPGMGGIFNTINSHLYHYAGNNPVKYLDPDGRVVFWVDRSRRESGWSHHAPQRLFGYSDMYDDHMGKLFDIQGTSFEMGDMTLRLWKGDYGKHRDKLPGDVSGLGGAGGEIGFYNADGSSMTKSDLKGIGLESTMLEVFNKETGEYVASREETSQSFWTTSFSWDKQGKGEDLFSINTLTFKDEASASNFADKLRGAVPRAQNYQHNGNESINIQQEGKNVIITWGQE